MADDFGKNMKKYAEKLGKSLEVTARNVVMSLFRGIVMDTPVGKYPEDKTAGRLRGNWQASVGAPILTEINRIDKNGSNVTNEIAVVINPYGVNYLSNNLPYAKRREQEGGRPVEGAGPGKIGVGVGGGFVAKNMARIDRIMKEEAP